MGEGAEKTSETVAQGAAAPVFISYASQDADTANAICRSMESQGMPCWLAPRDVKPGAQYADAIVRAINEAKAVVLVLSRSAVGSSHVAREVERAASKRKPIIPFRLDNAALNPELEYFLSNSQWIEVPKLGISAALARLKEAVGHGSAPGSQSKPIAAVVGKRVAVAAAILVVVGVVAVLGWHSWSSTHNAVQLSTVAMADKSIAVLPFLDMSEKKDQEYFGDGMAEEIIDLLVKVPGLKVIGRTSSFQFKGKTQDLRSIGTQLGVAYVLEGSVRKSGDHLRVTAQLIDSGDGTHLFSQTYDRELSDVLRIQDEIAIKVVRATGDDLYIHAMTSRAALRNAEAYTSYLQGMHAAGRFDQQGFEQAASDFQRALDLDPSFAEASFELGGAYLNLGLFGFMPPRTAFEQARRAVEHALQLDPKLTTAHGFLADIHIVYDWDWAAADRELKLARALAPNDTVSGITAVLASTLGQWDDALKALNASLERDPLDPSTYFYLTGIQIRRTRLPEAEAAIRRTLDLSETFVFAHYNLGQVLLIRGKPQEALAESLRESSDAGRLIGSAMAYFRLGKVSESDAALAQLLKNYAPYIPTGIAAVYAFRAESDEAFKWLDRAYEQKDALLYRIKIYPELDNLHGDPRYNAFLKKMNLPEG
jgi:TolB-like protein